MDDLLRMIDMIYEQLDTDKSGGLNFEEFKAGITRLPGTQKIHLTDDDFEIITQYGKFLSVTGEFNKLQFREMMQGELFRFGPSLTPSPTPARPPDRPHVRPPCTSSISCSV